MSNRDRPEAVILDKTLCHDVVKLLIKQQEIISAAEARLMCSSAWSNLLERLQSISTKDKQTIKDFEDALIWSRNE